MRHILDKVIIIKKHSSFIKGMATMLAITLIFSAGKSYAGVSDNIGSGFHKLGQILGIGKESSVPADKAAYDGATLLEKINYLEAKLSDIKENDDKIAASVGELKTKVNAGMGGVRFEKVKSGSLEKNDSQPITVNGFCGFAVISIRIASCRVTISADGGVCSYDGNLNAIQMPMVIPFENTISISPPVPYTSSSPVCYYTIYRLK